jgi:hypothetical protein
MKSLDLRINNLEKLQGENKTWVIVKFPDESQAEALKRHQLEAKKNQRIIFVTTGVPRRI